MDCWLHVWPHFESRLAHVHGNLFAFLSIMIGYLILNLPITGICTRWISWLRLVGMLMPLGIVAEFALGTPPYPVIVGGISIVPAMVWLGIAVWRAEVTAPSRTYNTIEETLMPLNLRGRSLLKLLDFSPGEIRHLLRLAASMKIAKQGGNERAQLTGKNIALIFEKDSTRARSVGSMTQFSIAALARRMQRCCGVLRRACPQWAKG